MSQTEYVTPAGLQAMGIEYSRQWLHALEQRGEFPKRLHYSPRRYHWLRADIEKWLADRHATAQPTVPPKDALTKALDSSNPLPFEAAHETATA